MKIICSVRAIVRIAVWATILGIFMGIVSTTQH